MLAALRSRDGRPCMRMHGRSSGLFASACELVFYGV